MLRSRAEFIVVIALVGNAANSGCGYGTNVMDSPAPTSDGDAANNSEFDALLCPVRGLLAVTGSSPVNRSNGKTTCARGSRLSANM